MDAPSCLSTTYQREREKFINKFLALEQDVLIELGGDLERAMFDLESVNQARRLITYFFRTVLDCFFTKEQESLPDTTHSSWPLFVMALQEEIVDEVGLLLNDPFASYVSKDPIMDRHILTGIRFNLGLVIRPAVKNLKYFV